MKFLRLLSPLLFLAVLVVILFYKVLFFHEVIYGYFDNFSLVIPFKYFLVEEVRKGIFPLWNPYILRGISNVGDLAMGTFSIFNIIYFLFPIASAVSILAALSIFLIGSFQYVYLRLLKISKFGSLFGAIAFAFAGTIFIDIGAVDFLTTIIWIPLIFNSVFLLNKKKQIKYFLLLIILESLQLLSGHPRPTFYTIQFIIFFLLFWSNFSLKKKLFMAISYALTTLLLTSIQVIPFVENALLSSRPLSSITFASSSSFSLPFLITSFLPELFGSHRYGTWWGPQVELFGYLGVPSFLFLLIGIVKGRVIHKSFYIVSLTLSLLLALGRISPVYILFYYLVPGWKQFRAPIDVMVLFTFFASVLIASGFDAGIKKSEKVKNILAKFFPGISIAFVFLVGVILWTDKKNFWTSFLYSLYNHFHIHLISRILIYDSNKLQVMVGGILFQIFLFVLFCLTTCLLFYFLFKKKVLLGISLLIFSSCILLYFDSFAVMTAPDVYPAVANPAPFLQDAKNKEYRILSLPIDLHQKRISLAIPDFFYKESLIKFAILESGNNIQQGVYQANGYAFLIPSSYESFIGHNVANIISIDFSHVTKEQLALSSVKYIVSYDPIATFSAPLQLINHDPGYYYVYANPSAYKRAYLENDPLGSNVQILKDTTQSITINAYSQRSTNLIISDLYYPGWEATVNGKATTIYSYKNTFQKIVIPKGNAIITLSYQPRSFILGLWISLSTFGLWILAFFSLRKKQL